MSRAPDLSGFPIPRKGGAKPIAGDDAEAAQARAGEGEAPESSPPITPYTAAPEPEGAVVAPVSSGTKTTSGSPRPARPAPAPAASIPPSATYGQTVATTVKLDENRYLRLMEAGKPGPGRLKRRTIQDMLIEALDEWFERRQL
jgi:hypothetical protein